jgi:ParB/RepB/Spo0J family partition protein
METIQDINPKDLNVGENSRWRVDSNLSELMEGIKHVGILQPIVAREEDNLVICGNRRLAAATKLGMETVPVRFLKGIDEKQLLILNLQENIQRKDISSIEIGRLCDTLLKKSRFKTSIGELSTEIGINENRVKVCIDVFRRLPPEFRNKVVYVSNGKSRKYGDLPENVVFAILNFNRSYKKLGKDDILTFLKEAGDRKLTVAQIRLIGILTNRGVSFKNSLKQVDNYRILRLDLIALKTEYGAVAKKEKVNNQNELFTKIVSREYPNLLF